MSERGGRAPLSERARSLRLSMWAMIGAGVLLLAAAFAAAKGWIPRSAGEASVYLFGACIMLALWLGVKARAQALADRERESGQAMIVIIAAQLARQDDAALERIAGRGGPMAEAATMILAGRRKARPSGEHAATAT